MSVHLQGTVSGILRATGMQFRASLVNFVAFYVVGLPLGLVLCFVADLQTMGMWIGLSAGNTVRVRKCMIGEVLTTSEN